MESEPSEPRPQDMAVMENILERVLERLEEMGDQMDRVASGQKLVESYVKKMYHRQETVTFPSSPKGDGTPKRHANIERTRSTASLARLVRSNPTIRTASEARSEGRLDAFGGADPATNLGFWPRVEFANDGATTPDDLFRPSTNTPPVSNNDLLKRSRDMLAVELASGFVLHPDSWARAIFDMISMFVLLYDSVMVPYQLAWTPSRDGPLAVLGILTFCFWVLDLLLGFVTGYHQKDEVVMKRSRIAKRYLQRGFLPSFLLVVVDFIAVVGAFSAHQDAIVKLMRFIKLQRLMRLSNLLCSGKVAEMWDWLATHLRKLGMHDQVEFMLRVLQLVCYILWVNHLGGCLWRVMQSGQLENWKDDMNIEGEMTEQLEYMLGFYWSASALISGGAIMDPTNTVELIATVFCIVFGFMFGSALISSLLTTVMEYQEVNKERLHKLKILRQFLHQQCVDPKVALPVVQQVHERIWRRKLLTEGDVEVLSLLSPMMRSELWYQVYGPNLADNPLMCACNAVRPGLIKEICNKALEHTTYMPGTFIFEPGNEAVGAYCVNHGSLDYTLGVPDEPSSQGTREWNPSTGALCTTLEKGQWVSEVALWVNWLHRGWLESRADCELLLVRGSAFARVLCGDPLLVTIAKPYSSQYYRTLKGEAASEGEQLSDLQSLSHESIVAALPVETRAKLSRGALSVLESQSTWRGGLFRHQGLEELSKEVEAGSCDLVVHKHEVQRTVSIVALYLRRGDGRILAQIAKCARGNAPSPKCETPGTKMQVGEDPRSAVERLVKHKMLGLADSVSIGHPAVDEQYKVSSKYGLRSRYMRTLYEAELHDEEPLQRHCYIVPRTSPNARVSTPRLSSNLRRNYGDPQTSYDAFVFGGQTAEEAAAARGDTLFIFAWLRREDYAVLSKEEGEAQLSTWVSQLDVSGLEAPRSVSGSVSPVSF